MRNLDKSIYGLRLTTIPSAAGRSPHFLVLFNKSVREKAENSTYSSLNVSIMRKFIITLAFTQTLLSSCLYGQNWKFRSGEEDWGETVYASQTNAEGATITIFSAKEKFKPAILISPYKSSYGKSFTVEIAVDKGKTYRVEGSMSDYFGEIQVEGIGKPLFQEMMIGSVISITLAKKDTLSFSLTGSSKAIGLLDKSMQIENASQENSPESVNPHPRKITPSYFEGKWEIRTYGYNFKKDGSLIRFNPDDGKKLGDGEWRIEANQLVISQDGTTQKVDVKIISTDSWEWISKKDRVWDATRIK